MKRNVPALILSLSALLCACANPTENSSETEIPSSSTSTEEPPNSSPSSEQEETFLSFEDAVTMLLAIEESENAISEETRIASSGRDAYEKEETTVLSLYRDGTSSSKGTIVATGKENVTYQGRVEFAEEKIRGTDGEVYPMQRRYEVQDYDQSNPNAPSDASYKLYILPNEDSAGGFPEESYILESDKAYESTMKLARENLEAIAGMAASPYFAQAGVTGFTIRAEKEGYVYETSATYSLTEEYIATEYVYRSSFVLNKEKTRLLSFSHYISTKDTNVQDPSDYSVSFSDTFGKLTYGEQQSAPDALLHTEDYFLRNVSTIALLDSAREEIDPAHCVLGASAYLFGKPLAYSPSSAADVDEFTLTPFSSSAPEVVALEQSGSKSYFAPKAEGKATLEFVYYGLGNDDVYDLQHISLEVTIEHAQIEKLSFGSLFDPDVTDSTLILGKTYRQSVLKSPSYAVGNILVASSDPQVLEATLTEGKLTLTPKAAGQATIDVYVEGRPDIKASETLHVVDPISPEALPDLLLSGDWVYPKNVYQLSFRFVFLKDGTGSYEWTSYSNTGKGTFSWTISLKGSLSLHNFEGDDAQGMADRFGCAPGVVTVGNEKTTISFESDIYYQTYTLILEAK